MSTSAAEPRARDFWLVRLLDQAIRDDLGLRTAHRVRAALILLSLLLLLAVAVPLLLTTAGTRDAALALGVVFVIVLGAGGLVCRGVGEHKQSSVWKSSGYFIGAAAYGATATVSLVNGVHRLLAG
ncbi:hypothetical protein [Cellulomonas shaoxiangyii]|uniref:Uncharacterized protein n=1 Tax=Cellulomonas shaoxiangyii TaxID=2566013 RepID=A0A4P7SL75_9CELL|nr:hypothetical protein [Cellulomonas shaoxiangyii]QCB95059.1 hypothetical protein E5225_17325 [Cellulomonas shaoxiangyii]TGY86388.1 hypothetical protein E5226_02405 [Cellulomonas shaoxiangyii]